jgi:hypothetical protein
VAGTDETGVTGYWSKAIFDEEWHFVRAPLFFEDKAFIGGTERVGAAHGTGTLDAAFTGYRWTDGARADGLTYSVPNFNILEGDCTLVITRGEETCTLVLHPVEMWTYLKRAYVPGRTAAPKLYLVTLEVPPGALDHLSAPFAAALPPSFAKNDRALFQYTLAAGPHFQILRDQDESPTPADVRVDLHRANTALFLTDGALSPHCPDFTADNLVEAGDEYARFHSDALVAVPGDTPAVVKEKIRANKALRADLAARVAELDTAKLLAFSISFTYLPLDGIARFSPLRFVDTPKIRTMTRYGSHIVTANHAYTDIVAEAHKARYNALIAAIDERVKEYRHSRF